MWLVEFCVNVIACMFGALLAFTFFELFLKKLVDKVTDSYKNGD